jgi:hypothetical protein
MIDVRQRRWFRFSLRTLFVAVTVSALLVLAVPPLLSDPKGAIEAAAIAQVAQRTSVPRDRLRAEARVDGDEWRVLVWSLPETPGGHSLLTYSRDGVFRDYSPGE